MAAPSLTKPLLLALGSGVLLTLILWLSDSISHWPNVGAASAVRAVLAFAISLGIFVLVGSVHPMTILAAALPWLGSQFALQNLLIHGHAGGSVGEWAGLFATSEYWLHMLSVPFGVGLAGFVLRTRARSSKVGMVANEP